MSETIYSGIDSIGTIPAHWEATRIKNILTLRSEKIVVIENCYLCIWTKE